MCFEVLKLIVFASESVSPLSTLLRTEGSKLKLSLFCLLLGIISSNLSVLVGDRAFTSGSFYPPFSKFIGSIPKLREKALE